MNNDTTDENKRSEMLREHEREVVSLLKLETPGLKPPSRAATVLLHGVVAILFGAGLVLAIDAVWQDGAPSATQKLRFAIGLGLLLVGLVGRGLGSERSRDALEREHRRTEVLKWILARNVVEQIGDDARRLQAQLALVQHLTGVKLEPIVRPEVPRQERTTAPQSLQLDVVLHGSSATVQAVPVPAVPANPLPVGRPPEGVSRPPNPVQGSAPRTATADSPKAATLPPDA